MFLGPPGTGKTHLAIGLGDPGLPGRAPGGLRDRREWVARLAEAHGAGGCSRALRLGRYPLIVIDEVGYIPFEAEAANLFFQLVSSRYERASADRDLQQAVRGAGARCSATTSSPRR